MEKNKIVIQNVIFKTNFRKGEKKEIKIFGKFVLKIGGSL